MSRVCHSSTRPIGKLLFPCFKTGEREPFCQVRREADDARTRRRAQARGTASSPARLHAPRARALAKRFPCPQSARAQDQRRSLAPAVCAPTNPTWHRRRESAAVARRAPRRTKLCAIVRRRVAAPPPDSASASTDSLSLHVSSFGLFSLSAMSSFQISFTVLLRYLSTPHI